MIFLCGLIKKKYFHDSLVLRIDNLVFGASLWACVIVPTANTLTAGSTHDVGLNTNQTNIGEFFNS